MALGSHSPLLIDGSLTTKIVQNALDRFARGYPLDKHATGPGRGSAVLFLMGDCPSDGDQSPETCLILNKRSSKVRQPGDLCFPGGGLAPLKDRLIAAALGVWARFRPSPANQIGSIHAKTFRLHLAAALREAWEEIGLNPFSVQCLGYLPIQHLQFVDRRIWPIVARVKGRPDLKPNWEVERIVPVALKDLLDISRYARFRPYIQYRDTTVPREGYPCFIYRDDVARELLWGATFRMVVDFLRIIFEFHVPAMENLPLIEGYLAPGYPVGDPTPSR